MWNDCTHKILIAHCHDTNRSCRKYWHQLGQWPLTSISHFVLGNVLRLPPHARWWRRCNIFLVFLASGLLHAAVNYYTGSSSSHQSQVACVAFFTSFPLGIAIEDWAQRVWSSTRQQSRHEAGQSHLGNSSILKSIGFAWVATWMIVTAPWMLFPHVRLPVGDRWLVPFSLTRYVGLPVAQTVLVSSGLIVNRCFCGEI